MRKQIAFGALALTAAVVLAGCAGGAADSSGDSDADGKGAELVIWTDE